MNKPGSLCVGVLICLSISGCRAESSPAAWQLTQQGDNERYQAQLVCETSPQVGSFQNCNVFFRNAQSQQATVAHTLLMEGGMPEHGHGLPTAPELIALDEAGAYRIEGLKYNMPGAWLLGFKLNGPEGEDKIIFNVFI